MAWPRVIPTGTGAVNPKGLDFYDALVDGLLARGITPFVTLYHWDLPQDLQDKGGWPLRDTAYAFAEYAAVVATALGDRVANWMTLNEPLCSAWIGHLEGRMAPGIKDIAAAVPASFHLHLGHGLGVQAVRSAAKLTPSIGIVNNLSPITPASDRPEDIAAAKRADGHTNRWWLDPIHGRGYPQDMVEVYGVEPPVRGNDLDVIAQPLDCLGVNYYFREVTRDNPTGVGPRVAAVRVPDALETAMEWEVYPQGLEDILVRVADDYAPQKIYVTENGSAWVDKPDDDGVVDDVAARRVLGVSRRRVRRRAAPRSPDSGLLRVVADRQLRVGVRLRQALWPGSRRLRHPATNDQDERSTFHRPGRTPSRIGPGGRNVNTASVVLQRHTIGRV